MRSEFAHTTLATLLAFANGRSSPERADGLPYPVYGSNGIIGYASEANADPATIVIGRVGSYCGSLYLSKQQCWVTDNAIRATALNDHDAQFLFYLLGTLNLNNWRAGSGQPLLNQDILNRIPASVPQPAEQRAIASVLGALDDKIEQNRRTARVLERLGRAIFRAWFVDFESVKAKAAGATAFPSMPQHVFDALPTRFVDSDIGPVPEHWTPKPLYETARFINGAAFREAHFCEPSEGLPVVKIAELKSGITEQTKFSNRQDLDLKYRIDTAEMLYSWSGSPDTSLDTFLWTKGPGFLNQHIFRVVTESNAQRYFVYYLLKHLRQPLIEIARDKQTTGLGHVTVADMRRLLVCWPTNNILGGFERQVGPIFEASFALMMENERLAQLRDYLLPKLLSGDVRMEASNG